MNTQDYAGIAPKQHIGKEIISEAFVELSDKHEAHELFNEVKSRLLSVNNWHDYAGTLSAKFHLADKSGKEVEGEAQQGYYLKVDIPAPGNSEGHGYDWVEIEEIKEYKQNDIECTGFRVRPASNPLSEKNETAHFYDQTSTSSFIVTREENKVSVTIIDRNIQPNSHAGNTADKIRDIAIGIGAVTAFSKLQWTALAKGLLQLNK